MPAATSAQTAPAVNAVAFTTIPDTDSTYSLAERIGIRVFFDRNIVVAGSPRLALSIGSRTVEAWTTDTGSNWIHFDHYVQPADRDRDGLSIGANALTLNGGTITASDGTNAALGLGTHAIVNDPLRKVSGGNYKVPEVEGVAFTSDAGNDSTYQLGERIEAIVWFDRAVTIQGPTGSPRVTLALTIGSQTRHAHYATTGRTTHIERFAYYVQESDLDADGISIGANALTLNGDTIKIPGRAVLANTGLGSSAIANAAAHKVDGRVGTRVTGVSISSPNSSDSTFEGSDPIEVTVTFSGAVDVTPIYPTRFTQPPALSLGIGAATRTANYLRGTGTSSLVFGYTVQSSDADADGISIAANALCCAGKILMAGSSRRAGVDLGARAITNSPLHKVDGSTQGAPVVTDVQFATTPASDSTYELGEQIGVWVTFDRAVWITGNPELALTIGSQTRYMGTTGWSSTIAFQYTVQATDIDSDGIGIGANALTLQGGTITSLDGTRNAVLGLGTHAIANDPAQKADGRRATAPVVTEVEIGSWAGTDSTYGFGDEITVYVVFDRAVVMTGRPQVGLTIGSQTRQATYFEPSPSSARRAFNFRYFVQASDADADGLGVGPALLLNGGTVKVAGGTLDANRALGSHAIANAPLHKVDGSTGTGVAGVSIAPPASDSTFKEGDWIEVTVTFNRAVDASTSSPPRLYLEIGSLVRAARYARGSGTSSLVFRHPVQPSDIDADGISIDAAALRDFGRGRIFEVGTTTFAGVGLGVHAISNSAAHKVDGSQAGPPVVANVRFASTPASDSTYQLGERVRVQLTFDRRISYTGAPQLALTIGSATRQAALVGGSVLGGTLDFAYDVQASDSDSDGIGIGASALALNGGTITARTDTTAANLALGVHAISNSAAHKVDGSQATAPSISDLRITSAPASGSTYGLGERVELEVDFDRPVLVTGTPTLLLRIGSDIPSASYVCEGCSGSATTLSFRYTVASGHSDSDGLSTAGLALGGGTINLAADGTTAAALGLGAHAINNASGHRVDGSLAPAPTVTAASISSSPSANSTYELGEEIVVGVSWSRAVVVTGTPQLALTIGSQTRQANWRPGASGNRSEFAYTVQASDVDADGISFGTTALSLQGGTINDSVGSAAATLTLPAAVASARGHKVNGGLTTQPSVSGVSVAAPPDSTFTLGDQIDVAVSWDRAVAVTGTPQLALTIGSQTRQAEWHSGTSSTVTSFRYTVQASDADPDGISIGASALTLNGGTIKHVGSSTVNANLGLGTHAFANSARHKVDGGRLSVRLRAVGVSSRSCPETGDTCELGERILIFALWERTTDRRRVAMDVVGTPQVAIVVGTQTRYADYDAATTAELARIAGVGVAYFTYVVQSSDRDDDGVHVPPNGLRLNGGSIKVAGSQRNAPLAHAGSAISTGTKVNGGRATAPSVAGATIASTPAAGDTYERTENIRVRIQFSRAVTVTGTPRLALTIGSQTRQANYASGSGTESLEFSYAVQSSDSDADGIGIGASALALNGGTITLQGSATTNATLSLGHHAIANSAGHKVAGARFTTSSVSAVAVSSVPASGDSTYVLGEQIEVTVTFTHAVNVTGTPQLALRMARGVRQADYGSGTGTRSLVFGYVVVARDRDTDGIGVEATALSLNGGRILDARDGATGAALGLGSHAIANAAAHKVNGARGPPGVSAVAIGPPPVGETFGLGDTVVATVTFNKAVDATGTPQLALTIGSATKQASYASGTGTTALVFRYVVVATDLDEDGISIGASALTLNAGTIDVAGGTTDAVLGLGRHAISNSIGHKVSGGPRPRVTRVVLGSPDVGDTFERGETVTVTLVFSDSVRVSGAPRVAFVLASGFPYAVYASGSGTASLVFEYTVQASDLDTDGISMTGTPLSLPGGATIRHARTNNDAFLGVPWPGNRVAILNSSGHKVNGGSFTASAVNGATITSAPASGDTYELGEEIEVEVSFVRPVAVTGTPQLALTVGADTRRAAYASGTGTKTLTFGYAVQVGDADANGIAVGASALALNGGSVNDARPGATVASLGLGSHAITDAAAHKVDASQGPPGASAVSIGSPPVGDTFERGEVVEVTVTFNKAVDVTGTPQLALGIGTQTRQADYASGTGTTALVFRYTVGSADVDADGISIGADALALNGGTIDVAGGTTDAVLGLGRRAIANSTGHKVSGVTFSAPTVSGATISSAPASSSTYVLGEQIEVEVTFGRAVVVTGTPQLALTIGAAARQAEYASGTGTTTLTFGYAVAAGDADTDGIGVGARALTLNGGAIADGRDSTTAATLGLGAHAIANAAAHKVDGAQGPPGVSAVSIGSPPVGDTFERGDTVVATVTFNKAVDVTGVPQLALVIGSATRQAGYASGTGTASLVFRYVVVAADADADGLSIGAGALALSGGTIDVSGGTADAVLGLGSHAVSNSGGHKVAGGTFTAAAVSGVAISSSPARDSTYGLGEEVEVEVSFARPVTVTGTPRLALTVGTQTRQADYASGTGTKTLTFDYTVVAADADTDGIGIGAGALALNGGAIADARDGTTAAGLGLGSHAIASAGAHKVDGSRSPPAVTGVAIVSAPVVQSGLYGNMEWIEVAVAFGDSVDVTGTPRLALGIGAATRQAEYASGTGTDTLVFRYRTVGADADGDGISIGSGALALNGGAIRDAGGTTDALLSLGSHAISNASGHRVNGVFRAPRVSAVTFRSSAGSDQTYAAGDQVRVRVEWDISILAPSSRSAATLDIHVGDSVRAASYYDDGSRWLEFRYAVTRADADADGVSIPADALRFHGHTLDRAGDGTERANTSLSSSHGDYAISNAGAHKVDGLQGVPRVTGAGLASDAGADSTYVRGDAIEVGVKFSEAVDVTGAPRLALVIGAATRRAEYATGTGGDSLTFRYVVVPSDADADGIGYSADALALNGGTIAKAGAATTAHLDLGTHVVAAAAAHKVDGSQGPPVATGLSIGSPAVGDVFERGETIEVSVVFNEDVDVTGAPQLALTLGSATRQASYAAGTGTDTLAFRYVVASGDADADGIGIGSGALALNGGTIVRAGGTANAVLALGAHAVANSGGHKVAGGTFTAAAVSGVAVSSEPAADSTYKLGESIEAKVAFGRPVAVTGSPRLALVIGSATRQAGYVSASSTADTLVFGYSIRPSDADADGIGIGASALTLNGGAINDARPGAAPAGLGLGSNAIANAAAHKVDGAQGPPGVVGLSVASPPVGTTFERGDTVVAACPSRPPTA